MLRYVENKVVRPKVLGRDRIALSTGAFRLMVAVPVKRFLRARGRRIDSSLA